MRPDSQRDIDFLFTGTLTSYRQQILESLRNKGYRVYSEPATTGQFYREQLLSRSCITLNLKQHSTWPYPSNSRFHYHLSHASLLLTEKCEYSCDLDVYVEQSCNIIPDAIISLNRGGYSERAEYALKKFSKERPMKDLMASLIKASLPGEILSWLKSEAVRFPIMNSNQHYRQDCINEKENALVCFPVKRIWQEHLLSSLGEVFTIRVLYMKDILAEFGSIHLLTVYTEAYINSAKVSVVFFDVERFHINFDDKKEDFIEFYKVIGRLKVIPFLFDDAVYREKNLQLIRSLNYEIILTACPISALKFHEQGIPAKFFPLEGHEKWYFHQHENRDIDILFYGTLRKGKRRQYLAELEAAGFSITRVGDEKRSLSITELCDYLRRSKIVINFSESCDISGVYYQFKGRILEAGFCGALCVSEKSPSASLLFGKDLPQFNTLEECMSLLRFFLENPDCYENSRMAFISRCELYRPVEILKEIFNKE